MYDTGFEAVCSTVERVIQFWRMTLELNQFEVALSLTTRKMVGPAGFAPALLRPKRSVQLANT